MACQDNFTNLARKVLAEKGGFCDETVFLSRKVDETLEALRSLQIKEMGEPLGGKEQLCEYH